MYKFFKRLFDVILSLLGIVITSPIWIITILGILINDFGPVFYVSKRIGKNDKEFKMFKFRSMRIVKNKNSDESSLRPDSERIFFFGKIIRKLKIDELPQLLNILNGTMSIVGPRPVAKDQLALFRTGIYDDAKLVRPGLTGPAALYDYLYGDKFEDTDIEKYMKCVYPTRRELELVYVQKMNFFFDLWMIFETVICIFCALFHLKHDNFLNKLIKMACLNDNCDVKEIIVEEKQ